MLDKILAFVKYSPTRRREREPAPPTVRVAGAELALSPHLEQFNGYPILDWRPVREWIDRLEPEQQDPAWWLCERGWLLQFRDALGARFMPDESETAAIVSCLDAGKARSALEFMGRTRKRIGRILDGIAVSPPWGKDLLIVFESEHDYYRYVSYYYPEKGEFAFSGGMHIDSGCSHFVTAGSELHSIERVIAHEMTHGCLGHLPLPLWLRFWTQATIQEFWSGKSFERPDEANMLSYDLARILVEHFARDWPSFREFALHADRVDSGAAAAHQHLGLDLGGAVQAMLETAGAWSPRPEKWKK